MKYVLFYVLSCLFLTILQELILIDIDYAFTNLMVTFFDRQDWCIKCLVWTKFELVPGAREAVLSAKWDLNRLQNVVQAVSKGRYQNRSIEKLRGAAERKRTIDRNRRCGGI